MAKKQTKAYAGDPGDEHVEKPIVKKTIAPVEETPKPKRQEPKKQFISGWEVKDRVYRLANNRTPLTMNIKSRGLYYFDNEKGYEREIQYCKNQRTCFVDEMKGDQLIGRIIFRNGVLAVPKNEVTLQKYLSLFHPQKDNLYVEIQPQVKAENELDRMEFEIDALIAARSVDIDMAEAIMRVELGSNVSKMSSKELRRDLLVFAKKNPMLFLDLMKDENIHLRNVGIKSVERGIITLSQDQRTFTWSSNNRKLMNVPFDEHPYSALASWFKTDEGMEVLTSVEKQLK